MNEDGLPSPWTDEGRISKRRFELLGSLGVKVLPENDDPSVLDVFKLFLTDATHNYAEIFINPDEVQEKIRHIKRSIFNFGSL